MHLSKPIWILISVVIAGTALAFHGDLSALTPRRTAEGTTVTVPLETVDVVRLCHRADDPECR